MPAETYMMAEKNPPPHRKDLPVFGIDNIITRDNRHFLEIELGSRRFALPMVRLIPPAPNKEAAIGWLDPNPAVNDEICEEAATAMADMLIPMKQKVIVMTDSSKSKPFIFKAIEKLKNESPDVKLILLPSGDKEEEVRERSNQVNIKTYKPVTGIQKYMGYPSQQTDETDYLSLEELQERCPNGEGLTIIDDVYTTGETANAMRDVLGLSSTSKHSVAVIAIERKYDAKEDKYDETAVPDNVHALFYLTEFFELDHIADQKLEFDKEKLHPYDKKTIPPALVS